MQVHHNISKKIAELKAKDADKEKRLKAIEEKES